MLLKFHGNHLRKGGKNSLMITMYHHDSSIPASIEIVDTVDAYRNFILEKAKNFLDCVDQGFYLSDDEPEPFVEIPKEFIDNFDKYPDLDQIKQNVININYLNKETAADYVRNQNMLKDLKVAVETKNFAIADNWAEDFMNFVYRKVELDNIVRR